MMGISEEKEKKRLELYKKGLSDGQISKICGCTISAIHHWRKCRNLLANYSKYRGIPLSNEENIRRLNLYNAGFSDRECAKKLGISVFAFNVWRNLRELPLHIHKIKCVECGKIFKAKREHRKRCDDCKKIKNQIYYEIRNLRSVYHKLINVDVEGARKIKEEMEIIEGKEFKEFALDGIYKKRVEDD